MVVIVKNCPALRGWVCNEQFIKQDKMIACQDCTDCTIKQVIEKCKVVYDTERMNRYKTNGFILANDILQLFDMEE